MRCGENSAQGDVGGLAIGMTQPEAPQISGVRAGEREIARARDPVAEGREKRESEDDGRLAIAIMRLSQRPGDVWGDAPGVAWAAVANVLGLDLGIWREMVIRNFRLDGLCLTGLALVLVLAGCQGRSAGLPKSGAELRVMGH